jgi:putative hydrolase
VTANENMDAPGEPEWRSREVNDRIALRLGEVASLLEAQGASRFRVAAYRRAANTLRRLEQPVSSLFESEGLAGLERLPSVGPKIGRAIRNLLVMGRLPMLDRLRGETSPEALLQSVPGIGRRTARRLHELGIDTLEELEAAAYDGRLAEVAGIGAKRLAGIRDTLATRLERVRHPGRGQLPKVSELLEVDREYRAGAEAGTLHRIAPRRFNPGREAWLPVFHTRRAGREYTALFSNTARAHELGRTRDWVVLYWDGDSREGQATVVTGLYGHLAGKRIVRGREGECERYYERYERSQPEQGEH